MLTDDSRSHRAVVRLVDRVTLFLTLPLLLRDACLHFLSIGLPELGVEHALYSGGVDVHHFGSREDAHLELFRERVKKPVVDFVDVRDWDFAADLADELVLLGAAEIERFVLLVCQVGKIWNLWNAWCS